MGITMVSAPQPSDPRDPDRQSPDRRNAIRSAEPDAVARAMVEIPRADFLPDDVRSCAAADEPLAIGHGQTNSQPTTVQRMLHLLDVRPGHRVLDVGSGSGWTAALLGRLVGETGRVHGVELEPDLAAAARRAVAACGMGWIRIHTADPEVLGLPAQAPFDRILVSADAPQMPQSLIEQLAPAGAARPVAADPAAPADPAENSDAASEGGLMVVPVRGEMHRIVRTLDGEQVTRHGQYRFVPLR